MQRQDSTATNNTNRNSNKNNSKCDIDESNAMIVSTTEDVQSTVHCQDIDNVKKQNNTV